MRIVFLIAVFVVQSAVAAIKFSNSYYSPRNRERPIRRSTSLIVLHTTEAPSSSALRKLRDLGECHYCVDERGIVYRIIDHRREATMRGAACGTERQCRFPVLRWGVGRCAVYTNKSP